MGARTHITVTLSCDNCDEEIAVSEDDDFYGDTYSSDTLYDRCTENERVYVAEDGGYLCRECFDDREEGGSSGEITIDTAQIKLNF